MGIDRTQVLLNRFEKFSGNFRLVFSDFTFNGRFDQPRFLFALFVKRTILEEIEPLTCHQEALKKIVKRFIFINFLKENTHN